MTIEPQHVHRYFEARLPGKQFNGKAQITVRCPFHDDKQASLSVNLDKGVWTCFAGCGDGGVLDFEEKISRCDRTTARKNVNAVLGVNMFSGTIQQAGKTYRYTDAQGKLIFEKLRYPPKTFRYRHEDAQGKWVWNLEGVKRVPYRLPELITAANVIYTEGEKDADNVHAALSALDLGNKKFAVTTAGGTQDWRNEYVPYFTDRDVTIIPDNDEAGQHHAQQVAAAIYPVAHAVKIVPLPDLPEKGDASDYLQTHTGQELLTEIYRAKWWTPQVQPDKWRVLFHSYEEIMKAPPARFAIEGFLQEEGITFLGGLAGHGKTLCMLAMARALLEGGKLFHHFAVNQPAARVIYLIPEAGLGPFSARLKTFHLTDFIRDGRLFCRTLSAEGNILLDDPRLLEAVSGADIFLDTAIRFMTGDENAANEQKKFADLLFSLQRAGARTITGAHHSPKSFGKDAFMTLENVLRGSGDVGAMLATCWGLSQIDSANNRIFVENVKARDFLPPDPFIIQGRPSINETGYFDLTEPPRFAMSLADHKTIDRKTGPGRPSVPKDSKYTEAVRLKNEGMSIRDIANKTGISKTTLSRWFSDDDDSQVQ